MRLGLSRTSDVSRKNTRTALWYEIDQEVGGRYIQSSECDTYDEAIKEAEQLVRDLLDDQDIGAWKVTVLPHWCSRNADCECSQWREHEKPYGEWKGMTLDDM